MPTCLGYAAAAQSATPSNGRGLRGAFAHFFCETSSLRDISDRVSGIIIVDAGAKTAGYGSPSGLDPPTTPMEEFRLVLARLQGKVYLNVVKNFDLSRSEDLIQGYLNHKSRVKLFSPIHLQMSRGSFPPWVLTIPIVRLSQQSC